MCSFIFFYSAELQSALEVQLKNHLVWFSHAKLNTFSLERNDKSFPFAILHHNFLLCVSQIRQLSTFTNGGSSDAFYQHKSFLYPPFRYMCTTYQGFFLPQFSIGRILLMCLMLLISPHTFGICWPALEFIVKSLISSNNAAVAIVRNKRQTFKFENLILQ